MTTQTEQPVENPAPEEELVATDDAVIGRAMRWSLVAVLVIGAVAAGAWYYSRRPAPPPPEKLTKFVPPTTRPRPETLIPKAPFTDVTADAGITFVHNNGAYGDKLLPE